MKKGVNVVISDKRGRVLVLKRSPDVEFSASLWDLPGGKVENYETLQDAVKRETKEESGFEVEPESNHFFIYHYPNGEIDIFAFRAKLMDGNLLLDQAHTAFKWVSRDNWKEIDYTPSVQATLEELFQNTF